MTRLLILLFLLPACQSNTKSTANTTHEPVDILIEKMNNQVVYYYQQEQFDSINPYLNQVRNIIYATGIPKAKLYWQLCKINQFILLEEQDSIRKYIGNAYAIIKSGGLRTRDSVNFYIFYDQFLASEGLWDSATVIANEAYYLAKMRDTARITTTSMDLVKYYIHVHDLPNWRKYSFEAWAHSDQEPELKRQIRTHISTYYDEIGAIDSAIYFFKQAEKDSTLATNKGNLADNYENNGQFLVRKGKIEEGYAYLMKAKALNDSLHRKTKSYYYNLGEAYAKLGNLNKGIAYIDTSIQLGQYYKDLNFIKQAWKIKAELYAKFSDYRSAYNAMDSVYAHSILEADSSLQQYARELDTKFAVKRKDNEINTLTLTNAANLKVRNQQRITIITLVVASLLLIVIGIMLWRRRQTQMVLRELNLKQQILRTRMDPHFMFNSLSILQARIVAGEVDKATAYLGSLGKIMRFSFENASENFVLLENEIEALDAYLYLQKMYRPGLFDFRVDAYPGYQDDDIYIPPMLLQPFIENTIIHGFSEINYTGEIIIRIQKRAKSLHCTIDDNGRGLQSQAKKEKPRSTNINEERLEILAKQSGTPASLTIVDKTTKGEKGVLIEMDIPFRKKISAVGDIQQN